jgi:hypothetical protein
VFPPWRRQPSAPCRGRKGAGAHGLVRRSCHAAPPQP